MPPPPVNALLRRGVTSPSGGGVLLWPYLCALQIHERLEELSPYREAGYPAARLGLGLLFETLYGYPEGTIRLLAYDVLDVFRQDLAEPFARQNPKTLRQAFLQAVQLKLQSRNRQTVTATIYGCAQQQVMRERYLAWQPRTHRAIQITPGRSVYLLWAAILLYSFSPPLPRKLK